MERPVGDMPSGALKRSGIRYETLTGPRVEKLEERRGRICAYAGGMWYILEASKPTPDVPSD